MLVALAPVLLLPASGPLARCPLPTASLANILGDFTTRGTESAENAKKVQGLLGLVARAAASRGKADLDAVRAFATLLGVGSDLENLEQSLGVSSTNTTDPSGLLVERMMEGLGSAVASKLESVRERRMRLALAAGLAVVVCEAVQIGLVLALSWLIGAGLSTGGSRPFGAALAVSLRSRATTRPLRLAAEVWVADKYRRSLMAVPPRNRPSSAVRYALVRLGALAALALLLSSADAAFYTAGAVAAIDAPLVRVLTSFSRSALQPLLGSLGLGRLVMPADVRSTAGAACAFVRARTCDAAALSGRLSEAAMGVKPLRAIARALGDGRVARERVGHVLAVLKSVA